MTYHDANRVPPVVSAFYAFGGAENTPYSCMRRVLVFVDPDCRRGWCPLVQFAARGISFASYSRSRVPSLCLVRSRVTQLRLILVCGGPHLNYFFPPPSTLRESAALRHRR